MADRVLRITTAGCRVVVAINTIGRDFDFVFDAGTDWAARLLCAALSKAIANKLNTERLDLYNRGWSDAKAKRAKLREWNGWLP